MKQGYRWLAGAAAMAFGAVAWAATTQEPSSQDTPRTGDSSQEQATKDTPQQGDTPQAHSTPAAPEDDSRIVRRAEEELKQAGYDVGEIDGEWDPQTKAAVTEFQKAEGLNATGLLSIDTLQALGIDQ